MAVIKMQELKLNRLYQSEDNRSDDFALEKHDNLSDKDEKKKQEENFDSSSSSPSKTKRLLSKSTFMETNEYDTHAIMAKERRSYSNSKLDYHKWQRALTRRPAYNRIDQWSSHVLSEYELKKFLKKANIDQNQHHHHHNHQDASSNNKIMTTSLNPIMVSSMNTQYWSLSNQTQRNHKCKSYSGSLHQQHHQQRSKKVTTTTAKLNKDLKSCNLISSYSASNNAGLKCEARASTFKALDGDDAGGSGSDMVIKRNSALVRFGHKLRNHLSSERTFFTGSGKIGYFFCNFI